MRSAADCKSAVQQSKTLRYVFGKIAIHFLLFHGDIAADDGFEAAMFCAHQERPLLPQGFGLAANLTFADADYDLVPEGRAMRLPLIVHGGKLTGNDSP